MTYEADMPRTNSEGRKEVMAAWGVYMLIVGGLAAFSLVQLFVVS
jgi:hypothetical protein